MLSNLTFLVVVVVVALTLRCLCYVAVAVVILNVVYFLPCSLSWLRFIVKCCNFQVVKNLNFFVSLAPANNAKLQENVLFTCVFVFHSQFRLTPVKGIMQSALFTGLNNRRANLTVVRFLLLFWFVFFVFASLSAAS